MQVIPEREMILGDDLDGHVGKGNVRYERVHGKFDPRTEI